MRGEKGITLTSLIIYIIGLIIVIGLISSFSSYFLGNTDEIITQNSADEEYTRFLAYFTKDINNKENLKSVSSNDSNSFIFTFLDGKTHEYVLENKKIYYKETKDSVVNKNIVLCTNVSQKENTKYKTFDYKNPQVYVNFYINDENFSNTFYIL